MKASKPSVTRSLLPAACPTLVVAGTVASPEAATIATRNRNTRDALFRVADDGGEILWERRVGRNFAYEVNEIARFSPDGSEVALYFTAGKRRREFPVPAAKPR